MANIDDESQTAFVNDSDKSIESLLLLDNTLLCNVETDNILHTSYERYDKQNVSACVSSEAMQNIKTNEAITLKTVSSDVIEWQDKTLMNQVFAQFDSQNEETFTQKSCCNISCLDNMFDTFCKEDKNFESFNVYSKHNNKKSSSEKLNTNVLYQHKPVAISVLQYSNLDDERLGDNNYTGSSTENDNKQKSSISEAKARIFNNNGIPKKKACLNNIGCILGNANDNELGFTEYQFYGLSNTVKELIQQVKGICELYHWQDECLKLAIKTKRNLIYALPTSGGKTLVAEILMLREIICNKRNAIFILPFVALVQEKVQSMAILALKLGFLIEEYAGTKGRYPPMKRRSKNSIYICTIEKALGLVNSLIETKRLDEIGIIVIDELHLLGESSGRGATLEGLLTKIIFLNDTIHLIGMSATIGNLNEIAQFLNANIYSQNFRPVEIKEYVKCENDIWLVDINSSELLVDPINKNYEYSQSDDVAMLDPDKIGALVMEVIPNDSCLIFCSSRKNCENVALLLTKILPKDLRNHKVDKKKALLNALKIEEGLCPILQKTIKFGVVYHHSGLTSEERCLLENAFRENTLCVICCTSTLAAGVNLPARRVILRSPYVGNQFLNLSRYKQMIGRAGRAGMGVLGESILICKRSELYKVKDLLASEMDNSLSSLHVESDRGIKNLILSAIELNMARTRSELHKLIATTLLNIQQNKIGVKLKTITDETIAELLKCGAIKVKNKSGDVNNIDVDIVIPSQETIFVERSTTKNGMKTITFTNETRFQLCDLGQAAMKGPIDLKFAYTLYEDLKIAQRHLILLDNLHLLYLVTPYDIVSQITPVGTIYYDAIMNLSEGQMKVARLLGITEAIANKLRDDIIPKSVEKRIVQRFYVTLIVYELWNHHTIFSVAEKYQINRGIIQNLLNSASMFASAVMRFCQEIPEFWTFAEILNAFSKKLCYCCPLELEMLMELPSVKIGRARQLYKAGYRNIQSVAKADSKELKEKIPYLNDKMVIQIIAAAKLLILQKAEDLKDEYEDVLEGISIS